MAMRAATRRLHSINRPLFTARSFTPTARVSSLPAGEKARIQNEASLPSADPGPDLSTASFLKERTPFMVPTYLRPIPMFVKGQGYYL